MQLNIKDMDIGALLGGIETVKECLVDAGFEEVITSIYLRGASNAQMAELAAKFQTGDKHVKMMAAGGNLYIYNPVDNYKVSSLRTQEDANG